MQAAAVKQIGVNSVGYAFFVEIHKSTRYVEKSQALISYIGSDSALKIGSRFCCSPLRRVVPRRRGVDAVIYDVIVLPSAGVTYSTALRCLFIRRV